MQLRHRLAAVALSAAAFTAAGVSTAVAAPGFWQRDYERNWFYSKHSCISRGEAILGNRPPWAGIPGVDDYRCIRHRGEPRWSMNLHWSGQW